MHQYIFKKELTLQNVYNADLTIEKFNKRNVCTLISSTLLQLAYSYVLEYNAVIDVQ